MSGALFTGAIQNELECETSGVPFNSFTLVTAGEEVIFGGTVVLVCPGTEGKDVFENKGLSSILLPRCAQTDLVTNELEGVDAFFCRAEGRLSVETEITSQYALRLLRRIKALIEAIGPPNLRGRLVASVDKDDRTASIEWIRPESRLGFSFDRENESSWFIVLPNGSSRSGYLYDAAEPVSLRSLLEEFVAADI
jgi:hypothetical protein